MTSETGLAPAVLLPRARPPFGGLGVRLFMAAVWNAMCWFFIVGSWLHGPRNTPVFIWAILVLFGLIGLGMVWDLAVRVGRGLLGRRPAVYVDRQPARLGERLLVRVAIKEPGSLAELEAALVGTTATTSGPTTITSDSFRTLIVAADTAALTGSCFDRTAAIVVPGPEQAPQNVVGWKVQVRCVLRQGGLLTDDFPLDVQQ